MIVLIITTSIHWGQIGTQQLSTNWALGRSRTGTDVSAIAKQIFYGICLGMLGLTGFECKSLLYENSLMLPLLTIYGRHTRVRFTHQTPQISSRASQPAYSCHIFEHDHYDIGPCCYPSRHDSGRSQCTQCACSNGSSNFQNPSKMF